MSHTCCHRCHIASAEPGRLAIKSARVAPSDVPPSPGRPCQLAARPGRPRATAGVARGHGLVDAEAGPSGALPVGDKEKEFPRRPEGGVLLEHIAPF